MQLPEHVLADGSLVAGGRAAKLVKGDVKPGIDGLVDSMVLVADLLTAESLF
jgi:hypothetical protein